MSRNALIAAAGSIAVHAGIFLALARVEPPQASRSIGRAEDGAIAVELLAGGRSASDEGQAEEGGEAEGSGHGSGPAPLRPIRPAAAAPDRSAADEPESVAGVPERSAAAAPVVFAAPDPRAAREPAVAAREEPAAGAHDSSGDGPARASEGAPTVLARGTPEAAGSLPPSGPGGNGAGGARRGDGTGVGIGRGGGTGSGRGGRGSGGVADWAELEAHLRSHAARCYPPAARRRGVQGGAEVHFCVGADGTPGAIRLESSSGSSLLDRAAIDCVLRGAAPLPGPRGCVTLPVWFRLGPPE
ncbi:MAG TPA: TonB family protein [Vulgatibacter sp.]|nr:TonB family protein [Vulgatibacter sp.]